MATIKLILAISGILIAILGITLLFTTPDGLNKLNGSIIIAVAWVIITCFFGVVSKKRTLFRVSIASFIVAVIVAVFYSQFIGLLACMFILYGISNIIIFCNKRRVE